MDAVNMTLSSAGTSVVRLANVCFSLEQGRTEDVRKRGWETLTGSNISTI